MCLQLKHTNAKQGPASPDRMALTTPWVSATPGGQDRRRCSQDREKSHSSLPSPPEEKAPNCSLKLLHLPRLQQGEANLSPKAKYHLLCGAFELTALFLLTWFESHHEKNTLRHTETTHNSCFGPEKQLCWHVASCTGSAGQPGGRTRSTPPNNRSLCSSGSPRPGG